LDDRIVDEVVGAATGAPAGDEVHEAVMRVIEIAEQDPTTTREALWALRGDHALSARYLAALDRSVGLAGRGLLLPADTWLQRLARRLPFGR